ncbi:cysteine-rich RLK (RECEPTOR-like protein kinase) 8 [Hibiscus trionum]|uniref:Cysteine-rich RLK (RECEPTOR-like protein kinase) 8 n=1 Tax=Hibiscus trionum TaxID=183268 RepID=A0A9W7M752_HIBTR|nr:cysteine-rich RLK (RECEPTOR-like protein kinase) 8 [Hibiscus trionum]
MLKCNSVRNSIVPGTKLVKDEDEVKVDATGYKQIVESLRYLTTTRPDVMYVVGLVSRYMEKPTELHLGAVKRILRYIKGTSNLGILYKKGGIGELVGYTDSDYARDQDDRRSTSGYAFLFGDSVVAWSSKKQPIVTLSTTEAEFVAAAACACQAVWMRRVLDAFNHPQRESIMLYCDNASTIKLSKNVVLHGRSKHIHVKYHFLRELSNNKIIKLVHCGTKEQTSDIMTKALKLETFEKLREKLGICGATEIN